MFMSSSKRTLLLFHWQADISPVNCEFLAAHSMGSQSCVSMLPTQHSVMRNDAVTLHSFPQLTQQELALSAAFCCKQPWSP